jgi:hypothetical protein
MAINIFGGHYTLGVAITNPGAVTNLQVASSAAKAFALIAAAIEPAQAALVTEAGAVGRIVRKTVLGTGTTSIAASTWMNHDGGPDSVLVGSHTATTEGTDTDLIPFGWNSKAGWYWTPTPEEYIICPVGVANGIAIKHATAPPAGVYVFRMTVVELG